MLQKFDNPYWKKYSLLAGIDEAGRGPLAGPVVAAAVILPPFMDISGLDDSKKLSEAKREQLYNVILEKSLYHCVAAVECDVIDEINILQATFRAMREALAGLPVSPGFVLVDGRDFPFEEVAGKAVIGGDGKSQSIAAASILAKVTRDRIMRDFDKEYPQYGFAGHKGYGTKAHREAIRKYGASPIHRNTFLKKILK